jgi:hypothetical protein
MSLLVVHVAPVVLVGSVAGCGGDRRTEGTPRDGGALPADDGALPTDGGEPGTGLFDCIDRANLADPRCLRAFDVPPGTIGAGPAFFADPRGGFLEAGTLVVAFDAGDAPSFLMSIDVVTGDRALRSGEYDDPALGVQVVGDGPTLTYAADVEPGADGWYVLTPGGLVRVDPATGDRELARPFAPCMRDDGPWQLEMTSFALADDGVAYLSAFSVRAGSGVVSLAPDGACEVVTWSPLPGYEGRGSGPDLQGSQFMGLVLSGGVLYASSWNAETIYRVDITTGDRVGISSSLDGRPIGTGDRLLVGGTMVFPSPERLFTGGYGREGVHVTEVDVTTGARIARPATHGPLRLQWTSRPPIWLHPAGEALIFGTNDSLAVFVPTNGNSFTLSY